MTPRRPAAPLLSLAMLAAAGCGGGSRDARATRQSRQADTSVTPLWSITYSDHGGAPGLYAHAAEVDDAGNTYVVAHDARDENFVLVFDAGGALQSRSFLRARQSLDEGHLRVNGTGFVTSGTWYSGTGPVLSVDRSGPGGAFEYSLPGSQDQGVDLCDDGSTVVASLTHTQTAVASLDTSGNIRWSTPLGGSVTRVRCLADGRILVAGTSGGNATATQLGSDGTIDWTWTGADAVTSDVLFDVDGSGNMFLGSSASGQQVVYALDCGGNLRWSWLSGGTADALTGISVSDVVAVTGKRGPDLFTASIDASGNLLWAHDDSSRSGSGVAAFGVSLDGADEAFVCGQTSFTSSAAVLYGSDGSTQWSDAPAMSGPIRADVTNGVARCIGQTGDGIAIAAYAVQ